MTVKSHFFELVSSRRSVRKYLDKKISREMILQCLEAARLAPSAENAQPWRFLVIDDENIKSKFADEVFSGIYSYSKFAAKAPVFILLMGHLDFIAHRVGKQIQNISFDLLDLGIAGEHIVLQAEDLGIGACWIGWFNTKKTRRFFKIPKKYKIVALLALGYSAHKRRREKRRKKLEEIVWFNKINH